MFKAFTMCVAMYVLSQTATPVPQPVERHTTISPQTSSHKIDRSHRIGSADLSGHAAQSAVEPARSVQNVDGSSTYPEPHITFSVPNAAPAPWSLHQRIAWGASLGLAIIGYVGIIIAVRVLKVIEAQTKCSEALAQSAVESANTTGVVLQHLIDAQRPWVSTSVAPSLEAENSFSIVATNRGSAPAEITSCPDRVIQITNDALLTEKRSSVTEESGALVIPILLLPGESTVLQRFSRGDVKWVCKTAESLRRVERSEDSIYIYGSIFYRDLAVTSKVQVHQTQWCCKYIHGTVTSGLAMDDAFASQKRT